MFSASIRALLSAGPGAAPHEMVEHKGCGHPDTLCDALAENLSIALSRFYLERFGEILHHNVDKALLCGGAARPAFGGGEVLEPIELHLAGRAVCEFKGVRVPFEQIAVEGSREWIREHLSHLDPHAHVRVVPHVRPVSVELASLFRSAREARTPLANDTSFGVGYAPLDSLETTVLAVATRLSSRETRAAHPSIGEDIKLMGVRNAEEMQLTVACALVGRHVTNLDDYAAKWALPLDDFYDTYRLNYGYFGGKLVGIPFDCDIQMVHLRKSIMEKVLGGSIDLSKSVPTYDELIRITGEANVRPSPTS